MLEEAISRLIEGILSGIGIGFIFYIYPVVRHTFQINTDISFVSRMTVSFDLEMKL